MLLDVRLPDMDGQEACKQMRKSGYRGPIVMLTAQDTEADTILGLGRGPMTISPSRFASGCCLPDPGAAAPALSRAKMRCSRSGPTPSSRRRRC